MEKETTFVCLECMKSDIDMRINQTETLLGHRKGYGKSHNKFVVLFGTRWNQKAIGYLQLGKKEVFHPPV